MAKKISADNSSSREGNWGRVFTTVVNMMRNLEKDREILQNKINNLYQVINQMKVEKIVECKKSVHLLGMKERDALIHKKIIESKGDEIGDLVEWFTYLSKKCSESKDSEVEASDKMPGPRKKSLRDEVRKLNNELERIKIEKKSEVNALLDEKKFVWNQYIKLENDLTEKLKKKSSEVELANEKITVLQNKAEELHSSNEMLRTDLAKMESDSSQKSNEISRLMKEIELLKAKSESETPLLRPCRKAPGKSQREGTTSTSALEKFVQETRSSKRKTANVVTIPDEGNTPKLFTSSFKVPKLKSGSSSPQLG